MEKPRRSGAGCAEEYAFLTHTRYGRGYVAYDVLADLVLAGWRPQCRPA
jgi:hypothetical protein